MKLPFQIDLSNKVVVITGAGGVLCSMFAEALSKTGAKIALLDLNEEAARSYADKIVKDGGMAKAYKCNVLEKASIEETHNKIVADFGSCDILINGAGGNNPRATTDDEYFNSDDIGNIKTFFDLDQSGVEFVFNLNFIGTLLFLVSKKRRDLLTERLFPLTVDFHRIVGYNYINLSGRVSISEEITY